MPSHTGSRTGSLGLIVAVVALIAVVITADVPGQERERLGDRVEYSVIEPHRLIFPSVDLAAAYLRQLGEEGWIIPEGTQILHHTYALGTEAEYERFVIVPAAPYDETAKHLILRRMR